MAAITPDAGKIAQLEELIATIGGTLVVRLYQNNYTPVPATVLANFVEATYDGYAAQAPVFGSVTIDANDNANATAATLTFLDTGSVTPNNIYGYYVEDTSTSIVHFAERFAGAPLIFAANGVNVQITPTWYSGYVTPPL